MTIITSSSLTYLVKSRKDVVSKLDLSNGCGTSNSYTNTKSHNPLLTKGSVEDSVLAWGDSRRKEEQKKHREAEALVEEGNKWLLYQLSQKALGVHSEV